MITAAFYKGKGNWRDRLIRWWTRSKFSHCEIVFSDHSCFTSKPRVGVHFSHTIHALHDWDLVPWSCDAEQELEMRNFACSELSSGYDYWGLFFTNLLPFGWESKTRWTCSEICAATLQVAGFLMAHEPATITPSKLFALLTHKEL